MPDVKKLSALMDKDALKAFRDHALNPEHPMLRNTVQNDDVYFQFREANNKCYMELPDIIEDYMNKAAEDKNADSGSDKEEKAAGGYEEMLPQAVEVVLETKSCSVSMLQRRVKLGYSRAARIVDQMEEIGIVGPFEGSKPRQILITREQWLEMQTIQGTAPLEKPDDQMNFADFQDDAPETWSD